MNLRRAIQTLYFPLQLIVINGLAIHVLASGYPAYYLLGLMLTALVLSFAAERLAPYNPTWNRPQGDSGRDLLHFVVNEGMNFGGIALLPLLAVPLQASLPVTVLLWPTHWGFVGQLLLAIVLFDIGTTLFHYLSHKQAFFWRYHAVHHAPGRLYGFNGIMKHPVFQMMDAAVAMAPLLLLGIPSSVALALVFCIFTQLLIQHSNVDLRTGPLKYLFATAEVHRFHHLKGKSGDVNFALFFCLWDRLLGTAFYSNETLNTDQLGVDEPNYPNSYWGQLLKPFQA